MRQTRTFIYCLLFTVIGILLCTGAFSQIYTSKNGSASFFSESPLENIDAVTKNVQSILNVPMKSVAFVIPVRGFKFPRELMEEHFNEKYMESDKYPNATFSGTVHEDLDFSKDTTYEVSASGKIKIHGVVREQSYPGTITVENGEVSLACHFPVALSDFKIKIPKLLFQNIADTVTVNLNVTYQPYNK